MGCLAPKQVRKEQDQTRVKCARNLTSYLALMGISFLFIRHRNTLSLRAPPPGWREKQQRKTREITVL